jgi:hypothetical protein
MRRRAPVRLGLLASLAVLGPATAVGPPADYRVACVSADGDRARARPGVCTILGLGFGDAGYWSLRDLRWHGWGTGRATAHGRHKSRPLDGGGAVSTPVSVSLTRLRRGCDERLWYTRAVIRTPAGAQLLPLPACSGPRA